MARRGVGSLAIAVTLVACNAIVPDLRLTASSPYGLFHPYYLSIFTTFLCAILCESHTQKQNQSSGGSINVTVT